MQAERTAGKERQREREDEGGRRYATKYTRHRLISLLRCTLQKVPRRLLSLKWLPRDGLINRRVITLYLSLVSCICRREERNRMPNERSDTLTMVTFLTDDGSCHMHGINTEHCFHTFRCIHPPERVHTWMKRGNRCRRLRLPGAACSNEARRSRLEEICDDATADLEKPTRAACRVFYRAAKSAMRCNVTTTLTIRKEAKTNE